jgi:hypothetical protein
MRDMFRAGPGLEDEPARGSKTRVMATSRSDGVVNVVTLPLLPVFTAMILVLFLEMLQVFIQAIERRVPEAAELFGPLRYLLAGRSLEPAGPAIVPPGRE